MEHIGFIPYVCLGKFLSEEVSSFLKFWGNMNWIVLHFRQLEIFMMVNFGQGYCSILSRELRFSVLLKVVVLQWMMKLCS